MSNSSLVSGLSEASRARFSLVEVSQESLQNRGKIWEIGPVEGLLGGESVECKVWSARERGVVAVAVVVAEVVEVSLGRCGEAFRCLASPSVGSSGKARGPALVCTPEKAFNRPISPISLVFPDLLGRLQPSKTTIQTTPGTLGVEESSSPRKVLHFYSSSSRGRMRAELWRFPA